MKKFILSVLAVVLIFSGCNNAPSFTTYKGVVVEKNSLSPIAGLSVKVTDGNNVYSESVTDGTGQFSLDFAHNASLGPLYIDINGGDAYPSKRLDLIITEEQKYDYGIIYLYDQTDETLAPKIVNVAWDYPSDKAIHFKNVEIASTYTIEGVYVEVAQSSSMSGAKKVELQKQANNKYEGTVSGLVSGEKYYFQVVATNTIGTGKSELYSRTLGMAYPEIVKLKDATVSTAVISIKVSDEPLETLSAGICWSTSPNPTINDNSANATSKVAADVMMTGLDFSKKSYYVRAFAKNANGISYSEVMELPANNPFNLPTFKSGSYTYTYIYLGKGSWYTANNACHSLVLVFDDWTLPPVGILPDFWNTYYAENKETLPLPMWSRQNDEYWESGETETYLLTTNGNIWWSKNESAHYYAVRKF